MQLNRRKALRILQQTIYIVGLLGLSGTTIHKTFQSLMHYLKAPTYTDMVMVPQEEAEFPSLTFCPTKDVAYKEDILKVQYIRLSETIFDGIIYI